MVRRHIARYFRRLISPFENRDMVYRGQKGQDKWVIEDVFKGKKYGFFVDLGAGHPIRANNTYILETNYWWNGICIEPNGQYYDLLKKVRNCTCVNFCIDGVFQTVEFIPTGDLGGIVDDDTDNCERLRGHLIRETRRKQNLLTIETVTLEYVLTKYKAPKIIDYLSCDVEGAETRILTNFPFEKYIFLAMTIERPTPILNDLLMENDYIFVKNYNFDSFYVHKSIDDDSIRKEGFSQLPAKES